MLRGAGCLLHRTLALVAGRIGGQGSFAHLSTHVADLSSTKETESGAARLTLASMYQLLCADHLQAQGIVDTLDAPVILLNDTLHVIKANPAFLRDFHVSKEETVGVSLFELGNGQWDIPELRVLLCEVIPKSQAVVGFEVSHDFPSIGPKTFLISARRLIQPQDSDVRLFVTFVDVSQMRKEAQEVDLLLAESQHRVNNALAVVHSIAYQTPTQGRRAEEYRDAYLGRLGAFLSTENLISRCGEMGVTLGDLVEDALQAVLPSQVDVQPGPLTPLVRPQMRPLRMILHELTTNAFKYGALSQPDGIVRVTWEKSDDGAAARATLDWREEGGPPVSPPDRRGFGVSMIERTASINEWKADIRFEKQGLHVRIIFPIVPV